MERWRQSNDYRGGLLFLNFGSAQPPPQHTLLIAENNRLTSTAFIENQKQYREFSCRTQCLLRLCVKLTALLRELPGLLFHSLFQRLFFGDALFGGVFAHVFRDCHAARVVGKMAAAKPGNTTGEEPNAAAETSAAAFLLLLGGTSTTPDSGTQPQGPTLVVKLAGSRSWRWKRSLNSSSEQ